MNKDIRQQFLEELSIFTTHTKEYGNLDVTGIDDIIDCFDKIVNPIIEESKKLIEVKDLVKEIGIKNIELLKLKNKKVFETTYINGVPTIIEYTVLEVLINDVSSQLICYDKDLNQRYLSYDMENVEWVRTEQKAKEFLDEESAKEKLEEKKNVK